MRIVASLHEFVTVIVYFTNSSIHCCYSSSSSRTKALRSTRPGILEGQARVPPRQRVNTFLISSHLPSPKLLHRRVCGWQLHARVRPAQLLHVVHCRDASHRIESHMMAWFSRSCLGTTCLACGGRTTSSFTPSHAVLSHTVEGGEVRRASDTSNANAVLCLSRP